MRLLERENALRSLSEYAGQAMAGAGRVLLVAGEAGAGKSSLLEQFEVETPKARWLRAACDGLFTPRPLGPLFDVAEQLGGPLLDAARSGAAREALFSAVLRQVDEPGVLTIVAIEDLHWADEATLDLLRHLGRRLRHATTMVSCRTRRATSRSPPVTPCSGGLPGSAPAHGSPCRRPHSSEARSIPGSCARCAQAHSTPSMPSSPPGFSLPTGRRYVSATS